MPIFLKHILILLSFRFINQIVVNPNFLIREKSFLFIQFSIKMAKEIFVAFNSIFLIHNLEFKIDFSILIIFLICFLYFSKKFKQFTLNFFKNIERMEYILAWNFLYLYFHFIGSYLFVNHKFCKFNFSIFFLLLNLIHFYFYYNLNKVYRLNNY